MCGPGVKSTITDIGFSSEESYRGEGVSHGLARGILVFADGKNITGEGMGIGAVAIRTDQFSCFARNCTTTILGPGVIEKKFLVDCRLLWSRGKTGSIPLTRFLESIAGLYMRRPALQSLFRLGSSIRRALGIHSVFEPIPPVAEATFLYRIDKNNVDVSCRIKPLRERFTSAFILNELAADIFTHGFSQGTPTDPPSGWMKSERGNDFYDPIRRLRFSLIRPIPDGHRLLKVWWGREYTRDHRWCGFEIEIPGIPVKISGLTGGDFLQEGESFSCSYQIRIIEEGDVLDA